jgi:putative transposon-encoded protein
MSEASKTAPLSPAPPSEPAGEARRKAKFEVYGEEMIEKEVKQSGNSGRVYLPPEWVGKNVKIIRID